MNAYEDSLPIRPVHRRGLHAVLQGGDGRDRQRQRPSHLRPKDGYSRTSRRRSPDREKGAIDHCFIYNAQEGVAVKVFDCITARFTVKLTDHYPYLIDAAL